MTVASPRRVAVWTAGTVTLGAAALEVWVAGVLLDNPADFRNFAQAHWAVMLVPPLVLGLITFGAMLLFFKQLILKRLTEVFQMFDRLAPPKNPAPLGLSTDWNAFLRERVKVWKSTQESKLGALQDRDDFRRSFIGNLAHELKTPLQSIQGYVLSLLDGAVDDPAHSRKFLQKAAKNAERMGNLLHDLDVITKEESGRLDLKLVEFDVIDVVQEVFDSEERRAARADVKLILDKESPASIYAKGDAGWITQVLSNLIVNSVNYGRHDGTGSTTVRVREEAHKVYIEVEDNGIGIDDESKDRIFERFYRVDKSRSRAAGGSGLGLAICKHLIEAHNESIQVQSEVGRGSTFFFRLPKA